MASVGLTLLILGCVLSESNWWPMFVIIFYVLCPITLSIGRRCASSDTYGTSESNSGSDIVAFITSGIVVSAFSLPAILFRAHVILVAPTILVMVANTVTFITILIYFMTFGADDSLLNF